MTLSHLSQRTPAWRIYRYNITGTAYLIQEGTCWMKKVSPLLNLAAIVGFPAEDERYLLL